MAKLLDTLMNRIIKGKLTIEDSDVLSSVLKKAVEQAESSDIFELPAEPTQVQLAEAMKHKFIKNKDGYIYQLILSIDENLDKYKTYISVFGGDDGIQNAALYVLEIDYFSESATHYTIDEYGYGFGELLHFPSSDEGKILVVNDEYAVPRDFFTAFTHSLADLDATLRGIIESSIADGEAKPCTQAQWNAIKSLLDKSLYFNYIGLTLIKSASDGINGYLFSGIQIGNSFGGSLLFSYSADEQELLVEYSEM